MIYEIISLGYTYFSTTCCSLLIVMGIVSYLFSTFSGYLFSLNNYPTTRKFRCGRAGVSRLYQSVEAYV